MEDNLQSAVQLSAMGHRSDHLLDCITPIFGASSDRYPETRRHMRRLVTTAIAIFMIVSAAVLYRASYYRTTSLTIDMPMLDWYAYREFSSSAQFYFYSPIFYLERRFDRSNPGYVLQPRIGRKP